MKEKGVRTTSVQMVDATMTDYRMRKNVGVIHTSGNLTLVQRKLANVLLYTAYDNLLTKRTHTISVPIMCSMLGWNVSGDIAHLREALGALQETRIEFNLREDGQAVWESMTMLSYARINKGECVFRYDEALAEKLYKPEVYALINLKVQKKIDSAYALNLYENCLRYKNVKTTGWISIPLIREILGCEESYYDEFSKLNAKVIKPAIAKVNSKTDIFIEAEYLREKRVVVAIKFSVIEQEFKEDDDTDKKNKDKGQEPKSPKLVQQAFEGMSLAESLDPFIEIRKTEAFQALRKHNISERLAHEWITEKGEKTVLELIAYTEGKDAKGVIKTNTGTYLSALIQQDADVSESLYEKEKRETAIKVKAIDEEAKYQTELAASKTKEIDMAIWAQFNAMEEGADKTAIIDAVMSNTNSYAKKEYAKNGTSGMLVKSTFISYLKKNPHLLATHGQSQRQNEQQHQNPHQQQL